MIHLSKIIWGLHDTTCNLLVEFSDMEIRHSIHSVKKKMISHFLLYPSYPLHKSHIPLLFCIYKAAIVLENLAFDLHGNIHSRWAKVYGIISDSSDFSQIFHSSRSKALRKFFTMFKVKVFIDIVQQPETDGTHIISSDCWEICLLILRSSFWQLVIEPLHSFFSPRFSPKDLSHPWNVFF